MILDEMLQKELSPDIYCLVHNKIVDLQRENKQLKEKLKSKPDTEITLTDSKNNIYTIIQSERIDMQEKLSKSIQQLLKENEQLNAKIKEYRKTLDEIISKMMSEKMDIESNSNKLKQKLIDNINKTQDVWFIDILQEIEKIKEGSDK